MDSVCVAGFGEIMLRLSPKGFLRLSQALPGELNATFGGGEANVCVSVAQFGLPARLLTVLPCNPIADALVTELRGLGVDTTRAVRTPDGRLGIYYAETGANQRGGTVVYDRAHSAIAVADPSAYNFDAMLDGVTWLHLSGITPAISQSAFEATRMIAECASARGVTLSCDLNFRKKLWRWSPGTAPADLAARCMGEIVAHVDVIIGNEEDAADVFGISAAGTSVEAGRLDVGAYTDVARQLVARFPKARSVAITLRESRSASQNNWGAMLYDVASGVSHLAPLNAEGAYQPHEIHAIVDRIGGGDSFCGGLIYALNSEAWRAPKDALAFAVAASCLKHSFYGDYNRCSVEDVVSLMKGNASGRVKR